MSDTETPIDDLKADFTDEGAEIANELHDCEEGDEITVEFDDIDLTGGLSSDVDFVKSDRGYQSWYNLEDLEMINSLSPRITVYLSDSGKAKVEARDWNPTPAGGLTIDRDHLRSERTSLDLRIANDDEHHFEGILDDGGLVAIIGPIRSVSRPDDESKADSDDDGEKTTANVFDQLGL